MAKVSRRNIFGQLFDIKPVNRNGQLDWERILKVKPVLDLRIERERFLERQEEPKIILTEEKPPYLIDSWQILAEMTEWEKEDLELESKLRIPEISPIKIELEIKERKRRYPVLRFLITSIFLGILISGLVIGFGLSSNYLKQNYKFLAGGMSFLVKNPSFFISNFNEILKNYPLLLEIIGKDNPQKYLLLFQNPSELRPTGGFIGSYGILDIDKGKIKNIFIDDVFNPDWQLSVNVIPPKPLQRISGGWSMHDANWFFDFPTSAKKIVWFYEKSGGATPDGIIAITPRVIEKLLVLTGSIEMPEYDLVITADNFIEKVQHEVETGYNKTLNQPKKILVDIGSELLDRVFNNPDLDWGDILSMISVSLNQKDILIYSFDEKIQKAILEKNWGGGIYYPISNIQYPIINDYLAVVHSNINGYKTDRVIEEKISHKVEIQTDGSIIDTVKIWRHHQGGNLSYPWYNQVNSDYLRVYLPLGSELINASGYTKTDWDYQGLKLSEDFYQENDFQKDSLVKKVENSIMIDRKTGTQIFEESGKTVFGNWVYLSPQEEVEIIYRYRLPFKIDLKNMPQNYNLYIQKQPGTYSQFKSAIKIPWNWQIIENYPETINGILDTDKVLGVIMEQK